MRASEAQVAILNNPGYQFGLIGALAAEANLAGKRSRLREQLAAAGFDQNRELRDALDRALVAKGYVVSWPVEQVDRGSTARDAFGIRKAYAPIESADSQLDVNFGFVGYMAAGAGKSAPYRPTVTISARLVAADGRTMLFRDLFAYNNVAPGPTRDAVSVEPDPAYVYPDFDDLDKADAASAEGLRTAIRALAEKIAERL